MAVLEHLWTISIPLCYSSVCEVTFVVPEVEELLKCKIVIKDVLFKELLDFCKVRISNYSL